MYACCLLGNHPKTTLCRLWVGTQVARRAIPAEPTTGAAGPGWHKSAFVSDSAREGVFFGTDRPSCPIPQGGLGRPFPATGDLPAKTQDGSYPHGFFGLRNRTRRPICARNGVLGCGIGHEDRSVPWPTRLGPVPGGPPPYRTRLRFSQYRPRFAYPTAKAPAYRLCGWF